MPIRSIDDERWAELVRVDPAATAFHHPAWAKALAASYRFQPFLVTVEDGDQIVSGLPVMKLPRGRRWVALPFTDYCGPLGDPAGVDRLVAELDSARQEAGVKDLEVRAALPLPGASLSRFVRHVVALESDAKAVERRFAPAVRRAVRRSEAAGAQVRLGDDEADLAEVFYGLHVETRRRLGLPVQPQRFFRQLWRCLGPDLCRTVLVEVDGRAVAGAVLLTWRSHLVYKYGASDHRAWAIRPNNLLFAEVIKWGCDNGFAEFDLGRTDVEAESLRRFKRGWGAEEHVLEYARIGREPTMNAPSARPVLRYTLRHSPRWLIRLAGEVVYRNAA